MEELSCRGRAGRGASAAARVPLGPPAPEVEFRRAYPRYRRAAEPVNRLRGTNPANYLVKYQSSGFRPNWVSVSNEADGPEMLVFQA